MQHYYRGDGHSDLNAQNIKNIKITDMDLGGRAISQLRVKTTRCDKSCDRFNSGAFCTERRWIHETRKLYRRRMLIGKKKYPVCLLRRDIAERTGCLRKKKRFEGTRQPRTRDIPTF